MLFQLKVLAIDGWGRTRNKTKIVTMALMRTPFSDLLNNMIRQVIQITLLKSTVSYTTPAPRARIAQAMPLPILVEGEARYYCRRFA
jgi:hypothetical protein